MMDKVQNKPNSSVQFGCSSNEWISNENRITVQSRHDFKIDIYRDDTNYFQLHVEGIYKRDFFDKVIIHNLRILL
jgi:hypothetical protein